MDLLQNKKLLIIKKTIIMKKSEIKQKVKAVNYLHTLYLQSEDYIKTLKEAEKRGWHIYPNSIEKETRRLKRFENEFDNLLK